jgi:hypothetical protein
VLGDDVKLRKSDLKVVIKECLREILSEDVQLRTTLVREALVDIIGAQRQQTQRSTLERRNARISEVAAHRQHPVPQRSVAAKQTHQRVSDQQPHRIPRGDGVRKRSTREDADLGGDLFEALVVDTLENTLPKQTDRRNPLGSSWTDAVRYNGNQEEGPATRLTQTSRMSATDGDIGRVQRRHVTQQHNDDIAPEGLEGVSLSQLREAAATNVGDSNVHGSALDDLGLTQRDWSAHVDGGSSSFDLAAFASELDD